MTRVPAPVTLTERQRRILAWLFEGWLHRRPAPSIHEMTRAFKLKSTNSVSLDLAVLIGAGLVFRWGFGTSRSLRLSDAGMDAAAQCMGLEDARLYGEHLRNLAENLVVAAREYEEWKAAACAREFGEGSA